MSIGHYKNFTSAGSRLQVVTWLRLSWYPAFPIGSYPSILFVWILSVCLFIRLLVRVVLSPTKSTAKNLVRKWPFPASGRFLLSIRRLTN